MILKNPIILVILLITINIYGCSTSSIRENVYCSRAIDGDTIEIIYGLNTKTVRLIGIDASESFTHTNKYTKDIIACSKQIGKNPNKCKAEIKTYADIAKNRLKELCEGKNIQLKVIDKSSPYDRYGRILAYVEIDGVDIGRQMLEEGVVNIYNSFDHPRELIYQLTWEQNND
ncbi:MAG: thermonuclease family protein [Candidatus Paceibacterota bacterium]|jgi:micrococcal nuclease